MEERDRVDIALDDNIERSEDFAEQPVLPMIVTVFTKDVELAPVDAALGVLGIEPELQVLLPLDMGDIFDKIETPSLGLCDNTVLLKDLLQEDVFFS